MWPSQHDEARRGIGAGVLGACPPDEGDRIARHVSACAECELEGAPLRSAMHWIGTACPRRRLLDLELFARRGTGAHQGQVAEFTSVLKGLSSDAPVPADLRIEVDGDVRTAADLIQVAATPGGD